MVLSSWDNGLFSDAPEPMTAEPVTAPGALARPLPAVNDDNAHFWRGGADGVLRFNRCNACGALLHPPPPVCRYCRSQDIGVAGVSGRGVVVGVTVNHPLWDPRFPPPFVIAIVAIEEDPRVRVLTNLADVAPEAAHVGMRVRVRFEASEDVWLPLFEPDGGDAGELPSDETPPGEHRRWVRPVLRTAKFENRAAIPANGMSPVGGPLHLPPPALTVAAVHDTIP